MIFMSLEATEGTIFEKLKKQWKTKADLCIES